MAYALAVIFKSNEHPFSTVYAPYTQPADDVAAAEWAEGMSDKMGSSYACTLLKDGRPLQLSEPKP